MRISTSVMVPEIPNVLDEILQCHDLVQLRKVWRMELERKKILGAELESGKVSKEKYAVWRKEHMEVKRHYFDEIIRNLKDSEFNEFLMVVQGLYIRDKKFKIIRFKLNSSQLKVLREVHGAARRGLPIRIIILKARQWGGSTLVEALQYLFSRAMPGTRYGVVSHTTMGARFLYGMYNTFWENDPFHRERKYTKIGLEYKDCGGWVQVESGYKGELWRGFTLAGLHLSEVAFWRDAESAILAVLQTVPDKSENTIVVFETTANGVGDYFYDLWNREGDDYIRVFVAWWEHEEYRSEFKNTKEKLEFEKGLYQDEKKLMQEFRISLEQLKWRRETIANKCGGKEDAFKQEYPASAQEAFLHSGRNFFSGHMLDHIKRRSMRAEKDLRVWRGELSVVRDLNNPRKFEHKSLYVRGGRMSIFDKPDKDHFYAIGVDVAEGIEVENPTKGGSNRDSDNSAITILDYGGYPVKQGSLPNRLGWERGELAPMHEVLSWYGKIEPDELAYLVYILAYKYNRANVAIERNNHGITTIDHLVKILKYPPAYCFKSFDFDAAGKRTHNSGKVGFVTGPQNRGYLFDCLLKEVRDDNLWMLSEEFVKEAATFIVDKHGKPIAQVGYKDDKLVSTAIAIQAVNRMTKRKAQSERLESADREIEKARRMWASGRAYGGLTPVAGFNKRRR